MAKRRIVLSRSFEKAYLKFTRNNVLLRKKVDHSLQELEKDAFSLMLKTHKLTGKLQGLYACSCGYDCRIVFSMEKTAHEEVVMLVDIGTHDEVY
ncbi:MAG: type II toxin-antitoxin system mRNA interferase toxin, RelE/StbE family [Chitinophagales bacterium]